MLKYIPLLALFFHLGTAVAQSDPEVIRPSEMIRLGIPYGLDESPAMTEFFEQLPASSAALEQAIALLERDIAAIDPASPDDALQKQRATYLEALAIYREMLATNARILKNQLFLHSTDTF